MKKATIKTSSDSTRGRRPAISPEAREDQMIALAVDLAEKQLIEGTASSQVITHYLKMASTKERIEREILEKQKELIEAKTSSLRDTSRSAEIAQKALDAFRHYSGHGDDENDVYKDIF